MKSLSRNWLQIGAAIAAVLILVNIAFTLSNARRLLEDGRQISHTHQVQTELVILNSLLLNAESSQRGYVITGDADYLLPYSEAALQLRSQIETVARLTQDNPEQHVRILELRNTISAKLRTMSEVVAARRDAGFDTARDLILTNRGKREMAEIRAQVTQIFDVEEFLLRTRVRDEDTTFWTTVLTGLLSGIAALVSLGSFMLLLHRHLNSREVSENELSEQNERLRTTLSSIGDAVITTNAAGTISDMNAVAESLTGWQAQDVVGQPLETVFVIRDEATRELTESTAARALTQGITVRLTNHTVLIRKNGSEVPIDDSAAPIRRSDGKITGCVLVFRDVSIRREQEGRLLWSEQTFRTTFDNAPVGIAHLDLGGAFLRVNKKLCEVIGYSRDELQSLTSQRITHDSDIEEDNRIAARLLSGEIPTASFEKRFVSKYGDSIWVKMTMSPILDGRQNPEYFLAIVEDIRDWRAAEETRIRMAAIIDSSNDAIIGKTFEGIIISWNPAAERLFGYTESEMIGQSIFKIVASENREEELTLVSRLRDGERVDQYETIRIRKDGTPIEVILNISPINDAFGKKVGISTIVRDITERRHAAASLRESEIRFRTLADNMSQLAWMADENGWIYWFNNRWYDYTGGTLDEMHGWGWKQVVHPDHVERVVANIQRSWDTGEAWEDTFPMRGKDSQYRWFLSRALPIRDDRSKIVTWFGSNTDITELKQYEETSQQARVAAENANSSRGEFLANMSHEIRTPMTAILGHADILLEHIQDPDNLQCVDTIRRNGRFLLQIINDILDLSKIDAGKFFVEHERVEPDVILADVHSLMDVRAQEKRLEFNMKIEGKLPQSIETDAVRLRQILLNLVGNAIKFTDQGEVGLAARFLSNTNKMQFEVSDTGIGISVDNADKLFHPFMQADTSSTRAYEGTGLGLAISRRLAQALGGDIAVHSQEGIGSSFTLTIDCGSLADVYLVEPLLAQKMTNDRTETYTRIDGCILVVDDRRDIRFLAQHFIERAGGKVVTATNGQEAIDMLIHPDPKQCTVDLVLMDMQMPVMDGYAAAENLRRYGFKKPIIALTANAMKDDRNKCMAAGCNDYATKPLDGPKLVQMIARYLANTPSDCEN